MKIITEKNKDAAVSAIIAAMIEYDSGIVVPGPPGAPIIKINPSAGRLYLPPDSNDIFLKIKAAIKDLPKIKTDQSVRISPLQHLIVKHQSTQRGRVIHDSRQQRRTSDFIWCCRDLIELPENINDPLDVISMIIYDPLGMIIIPPNDNLILTDITLYANFTNLSDVIFTPIYKYNFALEIIRNCGNYEPFVNTVKNVFTNMPAQLANIPVNIIGDHDRCTICDTPLYDIYYVGDGNTELDLIEKTAICNVCYNLKFIKIASKFYHSHNGQRPVNNAYAIHHSRTFAQLAATIGHTLPVDVLSKPPTRVIHDGHRIIYIWGKIAVIDSALNKYYDMLYKQCLFDVKIYQVKLVN